MKKRLIVILKLDRKSGRIKEANDDPKGQLSKKFPCIYALWYRKRIIRLGEASSGYSRIRSGFNQKLRHKNKKRNYYAYRWRERFKGKTLTLIICELPARFKKTANEGARWRRALEAELAWELRKTNGSWPSAMTEIHFDEALRLKKSIQNEIQSFFQLLNIQRG